MRMTYLGEELDVVRLLLADHDRVLEVDVDDDRDLALARLEERVAHVRVHDVDRLALLRGEAQAVRVRLQRAEALLARQLRPGDSESGGYVAVT